MKKILIIFCFGLFSTSTFAADPSATCPSDYTMIEIPHITLNNKSLSGTSILGRGSTCIPGAGTSDAICYMYAPSNVTYSNSKGTYKYTNFCPLT